jgi:hypothetical protein
MWNSQWMYHGEILGDGIFAPVFAVYPYANHGTMVLEYESPQKKNIKIHKSTSFVGFYMPAWFGSI